MTERKAHIFNIQKYNMYDGPGIRTIVFFKGCPLRCTWCSNPEGQLLPYQILYKRDLCISCGACVPVCPVGIHTISSTGEHCIDRSKECIGCHKCEEVCTKKALAITGQTKSISELLEIIEEDRAFYETSGGGVTLGGGEVLMQPQAAISLLDACQQQGLNTAIETCGFAKTDVIVRASEFVDLFLFDIKHMDSEKHRELTGVRNELILDNLTWLLENRCNVQIRLPMLKGINDDEQALQQIVDFLRPHIERRNFKGIDILPYHKFGVNKYNQLDWVYPIAGEFSLNTADMERIEGFFTKNGLSVEIVHH